MEVMTTNQEVINISTIDKSVDRIRNEIKEGLRSDPKKQILLHTEVSWLTFWENHRDFMTDEDRKWLTIMLIH